MERKLYSEINRATLRRFKTFVRFNLLIVLFCGQFACGNTPNTPISKEKLIDILLDVHTAEALIESENQNVRDSMAKIYYPQIFGKHGVTQVDFDSTMAIYSRHPTQLDTIYNRVLKIVKTERDSLGKPH